MELNFTELDNLDNEESNTYNYWDKTESNSQPKQNQIKQKVEKKKRVTFDDILTNMNLQVNDKGILQFMTPLPEDQYNQPSYQNQYQNQYQQSRVNVIKQGKPIEPEVKNSAIFNKYFKNYKDPNSPQQVNVRVPKTIQEYKQMLLEDKIKYIREKNRIAQIKPTKLLFTNVGTIQATQNGLRKMAFN
jgi:hypothetical protein